MFFFPSEQPGFLLFLVLCCPTSKLEPVSFFLSFEGDEIGRRRIIRRTDRCRLGRNVVAWLRWITIILMNERIDWWTHVFDGWKAWLTIYKRRVRAHCPRSCNRKRAINRRERKTLLVAGREVSRLNVRRWCEAAIRETVRSNPDSFSRGGWRNEEKENLFDRWQSIHFIFRNPKNLRLNASRCVARRSRNSFGRISIGIVLREIRKNEFNLCNIRVSFE